MIDIFTLTNTNTNIVTLNCRSVANKRLSIADFILSRDVDIMAVTET